ncbi:MAG: hypothetical protein KDK24_05135 [Pseudooceanicola sp.]|nr:hypothetical protein [Pseudooceanicola sp.]
MKIIHLATLSGALALHFAPPAAAEQITFPCNVTNACEISGSSVDCSVGGSWTGDYSFVWDDTSFTVNAPRGSFEGNLESEEQAWPIVILSWAGDGDPPALFLLTESGKLAGSVPLDDAGLIALQGTCGAPQ